MSLEQDERFGNKVGGILLIGAIILILVIRLVASRPWLYEPDDTNDQQLRVRPTQSGCVVEDIQRISSTDQPSDQVEVTYKEICGSTTWRVTRVLDKSELPTPTK